MDKILLQNMQFYGYHGVYEHEREMGQRFQVDVELSLDTTKAEQTDDLEDTLDYVSAYVEVRTVVETRKFRLLEALAANIAASLLKGKVVQVTVRVRKPAVPLPGHLDFVQAEVTRTRSI